MGQNSRKRKRRWMMNDSQKARVEELFKLIEAHSDSEDGQLLMQLMPTGGNGSVGNDGVGNDDSPITSAEDVVREFRAAMDGMSPERLREVRQGYWQVRSNIAADQSVREYVRQDALLNAKANASYAEMFADRNKR